MWLYYNWLWHINKTVLHQVISLVNSQRNIYFLNCLRCYSCWHVSALYSMLEPQYCSTSQNSDLLLPSIEDVVYFHCLMLQFGLIHSTTATAIFSHPWQLCIAAFQSSSEHVPALWAGCQHHLHQECAFLPTNTWRQTEIFSQCLGNLTKLQISAPENVYS